MKFKRSFDASSDDPGLQCPEIITEQHHKDRVDINNIIQKFTVTGYLPEIQNSLEGIYGDFSSGDDFLQSQLKIKQAEEAFMSLDAKVRQRFDNEPYKLLEFIHNPKNESEARSLGLLNPLKTTDTSLSQNSKPQTNTQNQQTTTQQTTT